MLRIRRHSPKQWSKDNPILNKDELGQDLNTGKIKIGDGKTRWNDLPFSTLGASTTAPSVIDGGTV